MNQEPTSTEFSDLQENQRQPPPPPAAPAAGKINQTFFQRTKSTILMLGGFVLIISAGQIYCALLIFVLNFIVFKELNSIKRNQQKQANIPMTKYINWYIYFVVNYYALGVLILAKFPIFGIWYRSTIGFLLTYHSIICCILAIIGFVGFVFSLKQGYLKYQFRLFGWIVMGAFLASYQSWYLIHSTFQGLFWYIVPALLIIVNDIFAYLFGYFFGKRPLIALSPKKTWEGYIGGAFATFLFTFILTAAFEEISGITCPMRQPDLTPFKLPTCNDELLVKTDLNFLPFAVSKLTFHVSIIGLIASLIGPFGGFFASGLKRSIKIKDFANSIPGHGGVSDRMDCQVIIGTFTYFYLHSFIRMNTNTLFYWINTMTEDEKMNLFKLLEQELQSKGLL